MILGLRLFLFCSIVFLFASCRPACRIASCDVRKVHHHGGKIYRGQPVWKKQNPHIGEGIRKSTREYPKDQRKKQ